MSQARVRGLYRALVRTQRETFAGDQFAQSQVMDRIRSEFAKNKGNSDRKNVKNGIKLLLLEVQDEQKVEELIAIGEDVVKYVSKSTS